MEAIVQHSVDRATDEAIRLWSMANAQYPSTWEPDIRVRLAHMIIERASIFALNARRAMEGLSDKRQFKLNQSWYDWKPIAKGDIVEDFVEALNRIIHARVLKVGYENVSNSTILGGALVIPCLQAETDRQTVAFIDIFSLAHCFLYHVLPKLFSPQAHALTILPVR